VHRRRHVLEDVALQIQAEPEQRSAGRALDPRSESGARRELKAADEHVVGQTMAARSAARHSEQPDAASPIPSVRAPGSTRNPMGAPSPRWSLMHLPPPSPTKTLGAGVKTPRRGIRRWNPGGLKSGDGRAASSHANRPGRDRRRPIQHRYATDINLRRQIVATDLVPPDYALESLVTVNLRIG
jgi:hypothetical protein